MSGPREIATSNLEEFVTEAILYAPASIRKAFVVGKCHVVGSFPEGTIFVIEENGQDVMIDVIVRERKA